MTGRVGKFNLGEVETFQELCARALDYSRQIVDAEHSGAPLGSKPVTEAISDLKHAANKYTLMMILEENLLPVEEIQRIDNALTARLNKDL